jgi:hypothetical protein
VVNTLTVVRLAVIQCSLVDGYLFSHPYDSMASQPRRSQSTKNCLMAKIRQDTEIK